MDAFVVRENPRAAVLQRITNACRQRAVSSPRRVKLWDWSPQKKAEAVRIMKSRGWAAVKVNPSPRPTVSIFLPLHSQLTYGRDCPGPSTVSTWGKRMQEKAPLYCRPGRPGFLSAEEECDMKDAIRQVLNRFYV
jgi:hypothetical protein